MVSFHTLLRHFGVVAQVVAHPTARLFDHKISMLHSFFINENFGLVRSLTDSFAVTTAVAAALQIACT